MPDKIDPATLSDAAKACLEKMRKAKVAEACIRTFLHQHAIVSSGQTGEIPDSAIQPVTSLDNEEDIEMECPADLLQKTVMLKLNGGLGTSMGLQEPKTLLTVKAGQSFLDFIVQQVLYRRKHQKLGLPLLLMNSFNTEKATREFLQKHYPAVYKEFDREVNIMQNQVPKILQDDLFPAEWPANPDNEWAPPGHGDLYTAIYGSGKLKELLDKGFEYLFVSNGDNLGATLSSKVLAYMSANKKDFVMEVCKRTESDKKGGHLAMQGGRMILREAAQCPKEDEGSFQDIAKYSFFNTNNLWIHLPALDALMKKHNGVLPLPVIRNSKTVDPSDASSPKVFQLETAMGAAIGLFENATAIVVPRSRFMPVKTCSDLLVLRSDAYSVTETHEIFLVPNSWGMTPTVVNLDGNYKILKDFEALIPNGVPSMVDCHRLTVKGKVVFGKNVVLKGGVIIDNEKEGSVLKIADGKELKDEEVKQQ